MMRPAPWFSLLLLTVTLNACAAKAQVRTETEVPLLDPPPPPPRVVAIYEPPPEPRFLHDVLDGVAAILARHELKSSDIKAGCGRCGACSTLKAREAARA